MSSSPLPSPTESMKDVTKSKKVGRSLWWDAWARLRRNRMATYCGLIFVVISLLCFLGAGFTGHSEVVQDLSKGASAPNGEHWFGTDYLGRDLFTRVLYGGQVSILVGLVATLVSMIIGTLYGSLSGYLGGRVDALMMRIVDILYAFPFLIFVVLLSIAIGDRAEEWFGAAGSLVVIFAGIGALEWMTTARIVRSEVLSLKKQEFVEAAQTLGLSGWKIVFRHLLPNLIAPVIIYSTLTIPAVMLLEASLSFLGLGIQPPKSSWGSLIKEGADHFETSPWMLAFPALFFSLTLFCLNFLGDGLRDALDPKSKTD